MSTIKFSVILPLALIFFLRMLPLFMLLPVLALAEQHYTGASPKLLGVALGIYGLTQALLQIPFGMLSDKFGRKLIITTGFIIFIIGSLIAAMSESIYGLILGRAIQGAGAIAAALMALATDLSSPKMRTKVMALVGVSIGLSFQLAFVFGPLVYSSIGLTGLFYLGAGSAVIAIVILFTVIPEVKPHSNVTEINLARIKSVWQVPYLQQCYFSIFISHMLLMANFVVVPVALRDTIALPAASHWQVYFTVLASSLLIMIPFISLSERLNKIGLFFNLSIGLIMVSQLGLLLLPAQLTLMIIYLVLFFGAFNYFEALLPSEISKKTPADKKGTALGIYATAQFIGLFIGGLAGGYLHQKNGIHAVHLFCLIMATLWLVKINLHKILSK